MLRARAQERASHRASEVSEHHDPAVARLIQEESHHKALAHVYLEAQAQHLEMQEALGEEVCAHLRRSGPRTTSRHASTRAPRIAPPAPPPPAAASEHGAGRCAMSRTGAAARDL